METRDYKDFISRVKKVNQPRHHNITNSWGVYDVYKYLRKNKWPGIGKTINEHDFYRIIRGINAKLMNGLVYGEDIKLPYQMGWIYLQKRPSIVKIQNGKIVTNLPIDWDKTLKLWYEDEESRNNKKLVYSDFNEKFKIYYDRINSKYMNSEYYYFIPVRDAKIKLNKNIKNGIVDAYVVKYKTKL